MRFMVLVKATKDSEAGKLPSEELLAAMAKFNEEMVKAGVMLGAKRGERRSPEQAKREEATRRQNDTGCREAVVAL